MPLNINLLSDDTIARGITPPDVGNFGTALTGTQDYLQKQVLQNLFAGGLPRDPNDPKLFDYPKIADMLARATGVAAIPTLAALRQGDIQQQALRGLEQGAGGVFSPVPTPQTQLPPSLQRTGGLPQQTSSGEDERRLRPDQPGNLGEVTGVSVDGQPTEPARSFAPVASTDSRYPPEFGPAPERFTQMAQAPQQQSRDMPPPPTGALITNPGQPGYWSLENADNLDRAAARANRASTIMGASGLAPASPGFLQQGKQLSDQAKQIRDAISKREELTPEIKQYQLGRTPGESLPDYQARQKGMETLANEDVKDFRKENQVIQAAGKNAFNGLQKAELAKNLTLDPNFYSGPLQPTAQTFRQFQAIFGQNPSAALPQEAFQKSVSDLLQEQIKSMGQSGVGRVLMSEVAIMRQAVSSLGITPQSNRALLEISARVYKQQQAIADIASKIKAPPGQMSDALDNAVRAHMQNNPLFSAQELRDPTTLGAPDMPRGSVNWTPQQARAHAATLGLQPGNWVRINGTLRQVP